MLDVHCVWIRKTIWSSPKSSNWTHHFWEKIKYNEKFWNCHRWPLADLRLKTWTRAKEWENLMRNEMYFVRIISTCSIDMNVIVNAFQDTILQLNDWIRWVDVCLLYVYFCNTVFFAFGLYIVYLSKKIWPVTYCCLFIYKYYWNDFWENLLSWIASFILNIECTMHNAHCTLYTFVT